MQIKLFFVFCSIFTSFTLEPVQASPLRRLRPPVHHLQCTTASDSNGQQRILFSIQNQNLPAGSGNISILKRPNNFQKWNRVASSEVRSEITWEGPGKFRTIKSFKVFTTDGETLEVATIPSSTGKRSYHGVGVSDLLHFNFPKGVEFESCIYILDNGQRAAFTGSN